MTKEEIRNCCANLEKSLLDAVSKGIPVTFNVKADTEQIRWNDISPIDYIYHGQIVKIKFGRPAANQIAKDNFKKMKCQQSSAPIDQLSPAYDPKEYE